MPSLVPRIDHVVINVLGALDEAQRTYERLGFQLTERGHHTLGTSNHLAIFGTDYLELLGFEPGKEGTRPDLVHTPPGLSGLVFKPPAEPGFDAVLTAQGVPADPAREFSRPVDLPGGGTADARFRTVNVPGAVANGRVFFCHHYTPELVWRDEWRAHANGTIGIAAFTIAAADPAGSAAVFGRMFGTAALRQVEGGVEMRTDSARVLLLTPDEIRLRYGDAVPVQADGSDRMVALGLRTGSMDTTRRALDGVAELAEVDGRLLVPAAAACGVALTFEA